MLECPELMFFKALCEIYDWECNNEVLRLVLENSANKWRSIQETEKMSAGDRHLSDTPRITKYVLTHVLSHYFSNMKF